VNLIGLLNPIIRGWANYHRHIVAKETFAKVDHRIWQALWQWCRRRHPKKGTRWIKDKYFRKRGTRNWVFAAESKRIRPDGRPVKLELVSAAKIRIWRHIKIRGIANPFDPSWDSYFKERIRLLKGGISRGTDGHSDFYPSAVVSSLLQDASRPLVEAE
jgi:RNA-directed DNA polymerase